MKKTIVFSCILLAVVTVYPYAQDTETTLPDVTTVVSGDTLTAGKNAVPDFSQVLPTVPDTKTLLPELPEATAGKNAAADEAAVTPAQQQSVYAEGLVGGGFPGFFTGNFSVYRSSGSDPFRIGFKYESADGYARNQFTDGFYDRSAAITGEKTFNTKNALYKFTGSYESLANGLQNMYAGFYDVTKQTVSGTADAQWTLPEGFSMKSNVSSLWYNRFAGITGAAAAAAYAEKSAVFSLAPSAQFGWGTGGFSSYVSAAWYLQSDTAAALSTGSTNRARFGTGLGWKNEFINIFGDAAAVVSTELHGTVVVPFTLGINSSFVTGMSSRKVSLAAEGGLSSEQPLYADLEKKYTFSALSFIPGETSDWYGKFSAALPVQDMLSFTTEAEYRQTAFGNGIWEPGYTDDSFAYGQYVYKQINRSQLCTDAGVSFNKDMLTLRGSWRAQWIYVPVLEAPNTITLSAALQGDDSKWGADADMCIYPDEKSDHMPKFDVSAFYRLTKAVRLAVSADDVVKLITGQSRTYAGRYIARSGSAGFLIKFFF